MENTVRLRDGTEVIIRTMRKEDLEESYHFFKSLAPEDRTYLRTDVTKLNVIKARIKAQEEGLVRRLVAVIDNKIITDGGLELSGREWKKHQGEIRLIVATEYQQKGLGLIMAKELWQLALKEKLQDIVVKIMRPQKGAIRIFKKLGFQEEAVFKDYVTDGKGKKQDLIVMRCDVDKMWKAMEEDLISSDWQINR
jgi:RimJ/RimL family protein N-acetyltransferase